MEQMANVLRTAGDETRLRILKLLFQTPLNVSELTLILGLAQSGISRHLSHLKKIPLIREKKEGMWSYYYPVDEKDRLDDLDVEDAESTQADEPQFRILESHRIAGPPFQVGERFQVHEIDFGPERAFQGPWDAENFGEDGDVAVAVELSSVVLSVAALSPA